MVTKEKLKSYASKLMFDMDDAEYEILLSEFDVILRQIELINKIDNISDVKPMTFPFLDYERELREDKIEESLEIDEVLLNAKFKVNDQVKVPKVVE